ncbi:MAG: MoxR family ATPase [Nitratireductor sp.]
MSAIDRTSTPADDKAVIASAEKAVSEIASARQAVAQVIYGQEDVVERALITVLSGGHALLVGLPGLAKTKLVETLGTVLGLSEQRIQFTPDLMPADILGSEILRQDKDGSRSFHFVKGPIFTQLLMADEINRASPRTQAALLQSMQEYHVTIAGKRYDLPAPFHVLATQNPLEQEGTYPLPEAQLDRFLMQIDVGYPSLEAEKQILFETTGSRDVKAKKAFTAERLQEMQALVRRIPVGDSVVNAILELVRSSRPGGVDDEMNGFIEWGPGPRASQALMLTTRARALIQGRLAPSVDDVLALAEPVLQHRMQLSFAARAAERKTTVKDVIADRMRRIG